MATLLAEMPDLLDRARGAHVADHDGRCAECGDHVNWPCDVALIAGRAHELTHVARATPVDGDPAATHIPAPRGARIPVAATTPPPAARI